MMKELFVLSLSALLLGATLFMAWLDNKHQWRLIDWCYGRCSNPFKPSEKQVHQNQLAAKDQQIADLQERVQTLEKIVTEPSYELDQKLNRL